MKVAVPTTFADIRTWVRSAATVLNRMQNDVEGLQSPVSTVYQPSVEPADPVDGTLYVDSTTGALRFRKGGAWIDIA